MEPDITPISFSHEAALLAVSFLCAFGIWAILKKFHFVSSLLKRHAWGAAFVDLLLRPAAVYGAGVIVWIVLGATGFGAWHDEVELLTQLAIYLIVASGIARLVEIRLQKPKSGGQPVVMTHLLRGSLQFIFLLLGLIAFLLVNNFSPTKLYVSTGAVAAILGFAMQQTLGDFFRVLL